MNNLLSPGLAEKYGLNASLHFYLLVGFAALLLFGGLHKGDLSGYDDAAYAYEAKTFLTTGNWWTLSLNGYPDFDKPPLFVWFLAASMKVFGVTDFAAKLPAALFGVGTILLVYRLAQELTGCKWVGVVSMLVLVSTQYFMKYATHAMTGVPFTFFFTLAILFYLKGFRQPIYWAFCSVALGAANWIRSPVGLIAITIIFFPAYQARAVYMKVLAQVAETESPATERILLYTWGKKGWGYRNQFIWYSNRLVELETSLEQVTESLQCFPQMVAVMDRQGFQQLVGQIKGAQITVLATSEKFVCFRKTSLLLEKTVAKTTSLDLAQKH